jgi:transcriptional regulator with XRE-family HTH domain
MPGKTETFARNVKRLRLQATRSLGDLAAATDLTTHQLKAIEDGRCDELRLMIASAVAQALNTTLAELLTDSPTTPHTKDNNPAPYIWGTFGKNLANARKEAAIPQATLAAKAGYTRSLVSHIESGHRDVALGEALGLADAVGASIIELVAPNASTLSERDEHSVRQRFARSLRDARQAAGMKQRDFPATTQSQIAKLESGRFSPTVQTIVHLAHALGKRVGVLFEGIEGVSTAAIPNSKHPTIYAPGTVATNLRQTRMQAGLTQTELSRLVGMTNFINQIERGQIEPTLISLVQLLRVLKVPVDQLFVSPDRSLTMSTST